jgi:ankyrin repeat protein
MKPLVILLCALTVSSLPVRADLYDAVRYENVERVSTYLAADTNAANSVAEKQCTMLHFAAGHSSSNGIRILKMLLAKGAKVDAKNHIRQTPLFWAVISDNVEGTKILLEHGANVNARQDGGGTPLHSAALNGYCEVARVLIQNHADVKAKNDEGRTPLAMAKQGLESWRKERDDVQIKRYQDTVSLLRKSGTDK